MRRTFYFLIGIFFLFTSSASALVFSYSSDKTVIGFARSHTVKNNESLIEIARKFNLGYNEIVAANPKIDPFLPEAAISLIIPTSWILPDPSSYDGILINLSEMRLYYFFEHEESTLVRTFPIGIGSEGNETPPGTFKIVEKIINPSWHVPESIRKEKPELPAVIPPGPDNPLGSHALRLSRQDILIHGTDKPYGVGRTVSHGCIRMYPEDIPKLFLSVALNTKVTIIRQPVKVGVKHEDIYIEVHKDKFLKINYFDEAVRLLRKKKLYDKIDKEKMIAALREKSGVPVYISRE